MRLRYTREPCLCGHCGPCKSSFTQSGFLGRSCRRNVNGAKSMKQLFALEEILSDVISMCPLREYCFAIVR